MWLHVFLPPVVHKTVQVNTLTTYIVDEVSPIGIGIDFVESAALCQGICEGKVLGCIVTATEKEDSSLMEMAIYITKSCGLAPRKE